MPMLDESYFVLFLITFLVIGVYFLFVLRRKKGRVLIFREVGLESANKKERKRVLGSLKINSKGALSLPFGANIYVAPDIGGGIFVCDFVALVGMGRYGGFSRITMLGFFHQVLEGGDFLMRKPYVMETQFEIGGARSLKGGWYVWCADDCDVEFSAIAKRLEKFGGAAILQKHGSVMGLCFRGEYLNTDKVVEILPEWRQFCRDFRDSILKGGTRV